MAGQSSGYLPVSTLATFAVNDLTASLSTRWLRSLAAVGLLYDYWLYHLGSAPYKFLALAS